MKQAALVRASGLSKQHVFQLLDGSKTRLGRMIADKTIAGLAKAFPDIGEGAFITKAAEAMGVPVDRLEAVSPSYEKLSNEALLFILKERLKGAPWLVAGRPEESESGVASTKPAIPFGNALPPHTAPHLQSLPTGRDSPRHQ